MYQLKTIPYAVCLYPLKRPIMAHSKLMDVRIISHIECTYRSKPRSQRPLLRSHKVLFRSLKNGRWMAQLYTVLSFMAPEFKPPNLITFHTFVTSWLGLGYNFTWLGLNTFFLQCHCQPDRNHFTCKHFLTSRLDSG